MTLIRKIILLLISFLILNVFSIYAFDFNGFTNKNENNSSLSQNTKSTETTIIDEITELKNKIFDSFNETIESKPFNLVLIKKNGIVEMNGLFANEEDAKRVSDILNINNEGEYKYEENRVIDEYLLEEIAILIVPFNDYFVDNSKLSIINNEVSIVGELKDASFKGLFESILSTIKIDLKTDITYPEVISIEDIKESVYRDSEESNLENKTSSPNSNNIVENIVKKDEITDNKLNKSVSNLSSKSNEIQLKINKILTDKKIIFERRSSTLTDDSNVVVKEISKILSDNPSLKIEIAGHTDSRGSDSLNKKISQDRASSVREVLISFGIDKDRINAVGYGEEFPIAKDDENGLSEINRRVEFNILGE